MPHLDTKASIGQKWPTNSPAAIQIWGAAPPILDSQDKVRVEGHMSCELVLCVGGGPALDLKWMPMGAWDDVSISFVVVADRSG
jgi:transcription factor C subunit 6